MATLLFPDGAPNDVSAAQFITALGDALGRAGAALEQADLAHAAELADDKGFRDARDTSTRDLWEFIHRIRDAIVGTYGTGVVARLSLDTNLPRDAQELIQHARHMSTQLHPETLGEPADDLIPVDLERLRERLIEAANKLEKGLDAVERERREAQETLEQRNAASGEWARVYAGVADAFVALASLAGFDEVAQRIKPTARRRAGRLEAEDEAPLAEDAPPEAGAESEAEASAVEQP
ncbi:hypothetical protein [Enhygromyxa salina]|uniref:hypothetical protein n=1 Tax=Enhygromyxa salina TaxID=215803 RepID=UPI0011BA8749|nr:hypothetical protein [Enhygromyxa salina]